MYVHNQLITLSQLYECDTCDNWLLTFTFYLILINNTAISNNVHSLFKAILHIFLGDVPEGRQPRHWQKVLSLISGLQLSTLPSPLPTNG